MNFFKNRFLFIILISFITLALLIFGAITLYKDNSSVFLDDGYIIEATTKTNKKYYFSANTKYKDNVDNKISFSDQDAKKVSVEPASFVHYLNGDVSFLKKGALVNLSELVNPMVSYYNITDQNVISYDNGGYTVSSNGKKISVDSFVGRISDNKYLIAGKNLSLKIPKVDDRIDGDYFEVLFIEEGIVKIDNRKASYQVTAQDSYIYVGDNVTISLGDGKIFFDGEPKMLLSQITINGDENIDLDVVSEKGSGGGSGEGSGTSGEDGTGDSAENANGEDGTGEGDDSVDGNGLANGNGLGNGSGNGNSTTASPQIELVEAEVTATSIDLSLQLNNSSLAKGDIIYYLTNVSNGERVDSNKIDLVNGTFKIKKESLSPSTEYVLTIGELNMENGRQYFQKTFKTEDLGITLEKVYASHDAISYKVIFDENSEVSRVHLSVYDSERSSVSPPNLYISRDDINKTVTIMGLESNSIYSASIDRVWINDAAYSDVYSINRLDTTLKRKPVLSGLSVSANSDENKFTIKLDEVIDKDKAIINYVYNIYKADDITLDNPNPDAVYSITKNDTEPLILDLNIINELKAGIDYRAKIVAMYDDNEMIRESSTDYSNNFLIKSKPNISFEATSVSMDHVSGVLTLVDANCIVPVSGRICLNRMNNFTLRYYKAKEPETTGIDRNIGFDSTKLTSEVTFTNLSSNTLYAVKLYGNYYDDNDVLHPNVQIGDTVYFTTDKSDKLHFEVIKDNESGKPNQYNVVTFDAKLSAPQESLEEIIEAVSSIHLNLYSGRYSAKEKLIGTYVIDAKSEIQDFFSNYTISNHLFTDATNFKLGKLNSLEKLVRVTNNVTNTLNSDYTVEVEGVYYSNDTEKFEVKDNVYTFHLTSDYYLDTRIVLDGNKKQIVVTPITKEQLSSDEYEKLSRKVSNLDALNKNTVVGVTIENTLSDIFVDSAYTYENVTLEYTLYNTATKKKIDSSVISDLSIDMGNKYQPKELTIYLDPTDLDDGSHFTRGYSYDISYKLHFITEDGSNPVYSNSALLRNVAINRQDPIYTQYISTSTSDSITYRYKFKDIDKALANNNFYYHVEGIDGYKSVDNSLVADDEEHDVVIPISDRVHYDLSYARKNTANETTMVAITNYDFEKEYTYQNELSYRIVDDRDNMLKIRLENNDYTSRAVVYKVDIKALDHSVSDFSRYYIASRLNTVDIDTGRVDDDGEKVYEKYKYIGIDYANISKFMKHEMEVSVTAYYDSGLVGIHQNFNNGLILKNGNKYLNVYNGAVSFRSYPNVDSEAMGYYLLKSPYSDSNGKLSIYNQLISTSNYDIAKGASYYTSSNVADSVGVVFNVSATNAGLMYTNGNLNYTGYNAKVLKVGNLNSDHKTALFDTIIPIVKPDVNTSTTINSIKLSMIARGIYGNSQFVKDGAAHRKIYVTFYDDEAKTHRLDTLTTDVVINGNDDNGYSAVVTPIEYKNLKPNTTYYYCIYAYIDGEYTQLYDSVVDNKYVTKTYQIKTLNGNEILSGIKFHVKQAAYNGEFAKKSLSWKLDLKNTENYKIRFELFAPNGSDGDAISYKAVNFFGEDAVSCNKSVNGGSGNAYISNCYITVGMGDVSRINHTDLTYLFNGNSFVFGDNYYKLIIYAIPYTNSNYVEDDKVILYENDSLHTTGVLITNGLTENIRVSALEPAKFELYQENDNDENVSGRAYVKFSLKVTDDDYVMKYGRYHVTLRDDNGEVVESCLAYIKDGNHNADEAITLSPCEIDLNRVEIGNTVIKFTGGSIRANSRYSINFDYDTYRNNVMFTEEQKVEVVPSVGIIYSPVSYGVSIGQITPNLESNKKVSFSYSGSYSLSEKIKEIVYTISLSGGAGNRVSGVYSLREGFVNTDQIFTVTSNGVPRFLIDVSDDRVSNNTDFTFRNNNTYLVELQYYTGDGDLIGRSSLMLNL